MKSTISSDSKELRLLNNGRNVVIILTGATSVGKSAVSKLLCNHLDAEIIIGDSVQIYKYLDIGSNKPSKKDIEEIPHHLINICEPNEDFSAADFVDRACSIIKDIISRNKIPIIVGGSTMWIQWLVHGIPDAPKATSEVENEVSRILLDFEATNDWNGAIQILLGYSQDLGSKIARNDWYRLRRYMEIAISLRNETLVGDDNCEVLSDRGMRTLTNERSSPLAEYDTRCFFMTEDREQLYRTIDSRCIEMLFNGLFDEVGFLLENDLCGADSMGAKAIGYRQAINYFCRENFQPLDVDAFESFIKDFATATRNYAKRQLKWYRTDEAFMWVKIYRDIQPSAAESKKALDIYRPYNQICDEILYYCSQSKADFNKIISDQMRCGAVMNEIKEKKSVDTDHYHQLVSQALVNISDPIISKLEKKRKVSELVSGESKDDSSSIISEDTMSQLNPTWSAQDPLIRGSEGKQGSMKLKSYLPKFNFISDLKLMAKNSSPDSEKSSSKPRTKRAPVNDLNQYMSLICTADKWILKLQRNHAHILQSFRTTSIAVAEKTDS